MQHVIFPHPQSKVHLVSPAQKLALCNRDIYWARETMEDVSCHSCWLAMQMVTRQQLMNLSVKGLEKVLDLITKMRNGDLIDEKGLESVG